METTGVLHASPPGLTLDDAREIARNCFDVDGVPRELVSERDQNFVLAAEGASWVLKVSNVAEDRSVLEMEVAAVEHAARMDPGLPLALPRRMLDGQAIAETTVGGAGHLVRMIPYMPGRNAEPSELDEDSVRELGVVVARLARALRGFFHPAAGRVIEWDQKHLPELARHVDLVADASRRALLERALERFNRRVVPALPTLRAQVIHNDVTLDNVLLDEAGRVTGIIDFGDMAHTATVLDVPASLQSLVREREDIFAVAASFLQGYTSVLPLEDEEADLLGDLVAGRMIQTILISAWRTRQFPDNDYITGWAEPAWALLAQLERVGFEEASRQLASAARAPILHRHTATPAADAELLARRERVLGNALEPLSYRRPLHLVRGRGSWMFDADGRAYLDAYNNVPVVGHAHPRVVDAVARQAALLNTNTRYLHSAIVDLAERIVSSMPPGLDTVMFVNSGSEANDLAWRLATTETGESGGLVTDWAYHGVTAAIADFSPSEWRPGQRPASVETFGAPDTYRGPYAGPVDGAAAARREIAAAVGRLASRGIRPAALFIDSLFTSDGIFAPPAEAVVAGVAVAREAGALYVADEVQAGHGRGGDGLWSFTAWGTTPDIVTPDSVTPDSVTPDIVTLGKPMGNGHPIAAVVARAELVDRLAAETTFFSTFGGNPVACIAAIAVLDVLEDERLVENAASVGAWLRGELARLAKSHRAIGDVRGRGLMIGVELVDRETGAPAGLLAQTVRDQMRERGVLVGTTRREANVLKIRPPLCIRQDEALLIVSTLDEVLSEVSEDEL
jgi:4-aminobutyrate aminotransferase-like enzyme/Ser/Thr protein kinase RdoA (MazF antagonist)